MGAVLAGVLVGAILSIATDLLMVAIGILSTHPGQPASDRAFVMFTAYRTAYGIAGTYLTARLAPSNPMKHAWAVGWIGLVLSVAGAIGTWNHQPSLGPHWYPVALVVLALPTAWMGGKLFVGSGH